MEQSVKKQIIAELLKAERPDLANVVATETYHDMEAKLRARLMKRTARMLKGMLPGSPLMARSQQVKVATSQGTVVVKWSSQTGRRSANFMLKRTSDSELTVCMQMDARTVCERSVSALALDENKLAQLIISMMSENQQG